MARIARSMLAGAALLLVASCAHTQPTTPTKPDAHSAPLPDYADLAARYNARLEGLDQLWSRTVITVTYVAQEGEKPRTEQIEGHFNFQRPRGLVLTFMKAGQMGGVLASGTLDDGSEGFWWIDLQKEPRLALVGHADRIDPKRRRELGLPVDPRDLIEILGLMPLPSDERKVEYQLAGKGPEVYVDVAGRSGRTRHCIDSATALPVWIGIMDGDSIRAGTRFSKHEPVAWRALPRAGTEAWRVPTDVKLDLSASGLLEARMTLSEPESGNPKRPRSDVFQFKTWVEAYNVREIESLDQPRPAP